MNKKQLFEDFIRQNLDSAYRFAYVYMKNKEDAEDVVSESVMKALKAINGLKNTAYLKTWFYRIIVNTAFTHLQRNKKIIKINYDTVESTLQGEDDYSDLTFYNLIHNLEEKYRIIIVLKFCEKMNFREISDILELNESTVKTRFYKALEILKIELEGDFDE